MSCLQSFILTKRFQKHSCQSQGEAPTTGELLMIQAKKTKGHLRPRSIYCNCEVILVTADRPYPGCNGGDTKHPRPSSLDNSPVATGKKF